MQIVETNIEELSKMLGEEYAQYKSRILSLEDKLRTIRIIVKSIQKTKGLNAYVNFSCNQILNEINEAISDETE